MLAAYVQGQKSNATAQVIITNPGSSTVNLPSGQKVLVQVVARPIFAGDETQDVVLNRSVVNVSVSKLAPGKSVTVSVSIQFPTSLALGDYLLVAKVDTGAALAETDEANNEATFANIVNIDTPFSEPSIAYHPGTVIPANVVSDGRAVPLKFDITNNGNVTIPSHETASIAIIAHDISNSSPDVTLQTFTITLTGIGPGKLKTFSFSPKLLGLTVGTTYDIDAELTTDLPRDDAGNNTVASATTMTVNQAFFNLAINPATASYTPAVVKGAPIPGTVTVGIQNQSNSIIPSGRQVLVTLVLRPVGELVATDDISIGQQNVTVGGLSISATRTVNINTTIPATLPNLDPIATGDYEIVATMSQLVDGESTTDDNQSVGQVVHLAAAFQDLAITSAGNTFPLPSPTGKSAIGSVILRNMGNQPIQRPGDREVFRFAAGRPRRHASPWHRNVPGQSFARPEHPHA